jgi:hypothetical protein
VPGVERHHAHGQGRVPQKRREQAEPVAVQWGTHHGRNDVVGRSEQDGHCEAEDHRIGVNGTQAAETQPANRTQEVGGHQFRRGHQAHEGAVDHPGHAADEEGEDRRPPRGPDIRIVGIPAHR